MKFIMSTSHSSIFPSSSPLRSAALQPATLRSYHKHLISFLDYTRLSLQQLLSLTHRSIDRSLSDYIDLSYSRGGSYDYACHTLNSLVFHSPHLRHRLVESRLRLRGWNRIRVSTSHPPITFELTVLFSCTLAKQGLLDRSVAMLLAFHCYLRVGELTRLHYDDIIQPNDSRLGDAHVGMAIRLSETKTGKNQWVSITNSDIGSVLICFLHHRYGTGIGNPRIFPFSPSSFRHSLRQLCSAFHLSSIPYVPHSFRHGGASTDFMTGSTIEQIMYRGRWKSMESARRYIQTGRALLADHHIPSRLIHDGQILVKSIVPILSDYIHSAPSRPGRHVRFRV